MGLRKNARGPFRRFWFEGPGSFIIAILLALFVRWSLFEAYVIPSASMLPTLLQHDHIFVNKSIYGLRVPFSDRWLVHWGAPSRGEVVVFRFPNNKDLIYIKRVIGLPGDRVFYEGGNLYINEKLVERHVPTELKFEWDWLRDADFPGEVRLGGKQNYVHWQEEMGDAKYSILLKKESGSTPKFGPFVVPEGRYFVMGDNRDNSLDSRGWDAHATHAEGEVIFTRGSAGDSVNIPKGTLLKTSETDSLAASFETTEDVVLNGMDVRAPVRCREPGAGGNVAPGVIRFGPEDLAKRGIQVNNLDAFKGGEDRRFVPRDFIIGRASMVWLSCEDQLPMIRYLCDPLKIRWNRFFHFVR